MKYIPWINSALLTAGLVYLVVGLSGCSNLYTREDLAHDQAARGQIEEPPDLDTRDDAEILAREIEATTPQGGDPIIPFAELPGPGECRIWYPGKSPLEQPSAGPCADLDGKVPPGAWLVYRPADAPQLIQIREYPVQADGVVVVKNYDAQTGEYMGPGLR